MSTTADPRFQCRHILASGRRCGSPALKEENFCYFHHQNRRPVENLRDRRARQETFLMGDLEDRASIQLSIAEVLSRLAANSLDPRRAGLLLYGLQIASSNLPPAKAEPETKRTAPVEEIVLDPIHGPIAPVIDFEKAEHEKSLGEVLMEQWRMEASAETIPTLHAVAAGTLPVPHLREAKVGIVCGSRRRTPRRGARSNSCRFPSISHTPAQFVGKIGGVPGQNRKLAPPEALRLTSPRLHLRRAGSALVIAGAALLAVYLVPTVYGAAMSRLAVAEFRAANASHRDWDSARIRAYQRSLSVKFAPPEAVLRIPRLGLEVPVLEGNDDLTMNRAAGHIPGTALPGQPGNVAIAGHRDGFFRPLKDIAAGDRIDLDRPGGQVDHYTVQDLRIVQPSDTSALQPTAGPALTLVTCYPFHFVGSAPQRFVVRATLVSTSSSAPNPSGD
jgi:sortase A